MRTLGVAAIVFAAGSAHAEGDQVDTLGEAAMRSHAGDHAGAIERYVQAYRSDGDVELLAIVGSEYRDAGRPREAIQNFCAYLAVEPRGPNAAFAVAQVRAVQAELGKQIPSDRDVCLPVAAVDLALSPPSLTPPSRPPPSLSPGAAELVAPQGWSDLELAGAGIAALGLATIGAGAYLGAERSRDAGLLLCATGSVALATASVLYVVGRRARIASDRLAVVPAVSLAGAGLTVSGGF
jgi:hypothetical protein